MKNLQNFKWILVLFLALLTAQACDKDELIEIEPDATTNNGITSETTNEEGHITLYKVDGGNLTKETDFTVTGSSLEFQSDIVKHQEIWGLVKKIFPQKYLDKLNQFVLFSSEIEGAGTAGFVIQTSDDSSTWQLGVAIDAAYIDGFNTDGELGYVLVHELAHIITGDESQIDSSISESSCPNYYPGSGCAKEDSYQNIFFNQFWADIWSEFSPLNVSESEEEAFYQKYKDRFVSRYAASNPVEDISEVFATFVIEDEINETGITKEKVQQMYNSPELVEIRNFIRGNTTFN